MKTCFPKCPRIDFLGDVSFSPPRKTRLQDSACGLKSSCSVAHASSRPLRKSTRGHPRNKFCLLPIYSSVQWCLETLSSSCVRKEFTESQGYKQSIMTISPQRLFSTGHMALVCFSSSPPGNGKIKIVRVAPSHEFFYFAEAPRIYEKHTPSGQEKTVFAAKSQDLRQVHAAGVEEHCLLCSQSAKGNASERRVEDIRYDLRGSAAVSGVVCEL